MYLRDEFSRLRVDNAVADLRLEEQIRGLVAARRFGLVYPLRRRAVYPKVSAMAADDDDVLPVGAEQRHDQQAAPVEGLVYSALRSPPFFCLEQRHFQTRLRYSAALRRNRKREITVIVGGLYAGLL